MDNSTFLVEGILDFDENYFQNYVLSNKFNVSGELEYQKISDHIIKNFDSIKYKCNPRSHFSYLPDKYAVLEHLLSIDSDLKEAYLLKEEYREFNLTEDYNAEFSLNKLIDFINKFKKSKFEEFIEFGRLLNHWKYYIVNSFIRINGKRMSNGPMESTNGRIGRIIEDGYGYTNFNRFRNRCMFSLNNEESINIEKLKQK